MVRCVQCVRGSFPFSVACLSVSWRVSVSLSLPLCASLLGVSSVRSFNWNVFHAESRKPAHMCVRGGMHPSLWARVLPSYRPRYLVLVHHTSVLSPSDSRLRVLPLARRQTLVVALASLHISTMQLVPCPRLASPRAHPHICTCKDTHARTTCKGRTYTHTYTRAHARLQTCGPCEIEYASSFANGVFIAASCACPGTAFPGKW